MFKAKISPKFFYLGVILILIFLLGLTGVLKPFRKLGEKSLIVPLRQRLFDLRQFMVPGSGNQTESRLLELEAKIASLEEENKQQKRLLSTPLPKDWQFLSVKVIGTENETLILYLTDNETVHQGMVAITSDTYLGKIAKISDLQAVVELPSFFDNKLSVSVFSQKDHALIARGLLVGGGEGKMKIEQIFLSENVSVGDLVMTSVFGKDFLIGEVSEVIDKKGEMFKTAMVKRSFNPRQLKTIFLINK